MVNFTITLVANLITSVTESIAEQITTNITESITDSITESITESINKQIIYIADRLVSTIVELTVICSFCYLIYCGYMIMFAKKEYVHRLYFGYCGLSIAMIIRVLLKNY